MKHGALLTAGLIGAVLLVQGIGAAVTIPGALAGGVTFVSPVASTVTTVASAAHTSTRLAIAATQSAVAAPAASASSSASSAGISTSSSGATATSASAAAAASAAQSLSGSAQKSATQTTIGYGTLHTLISHETVTPSCASAPGGETAGAPGDHSADNIPGTSSADIDSFATEYNAIRVAHCLAPVPTANIRFSSCLEQRLFWMADDPSTDPLSAWGHTGTAKRSDNVPIVGCDGDLAGGTSYTGASVANAWWSSIDHRDSLYQPSYKGSNSDKCVYFALTHGGYNVPAPNEPYSFTRAAAYWASC